MVDYSGITCEEFDEGVRMVAARMGTELVLDIPGVFECVSEELNNEVLDLLRPDTGDDEDEEDDDPEA
jgi:hypothetical protein